MKQVLNFCNEHDKHDLFDKLQEISIKKGIPVEDLTALDYLNSMIEQIQKNALRDVMYEGKLIRVNLNKSKIISSDWTFSASDLYYRFFVKIEIDKSILDSAKVLV